jgi:hypothetical protein
MESAKDWLMIGLLKVAAGVGLLLAYTALIILYPIHLISKMLE